ncbi:hypothetical protein AGR1A_Cc20840 [Agrobacterium fabacearum CFBP 5771]|nr:hypothetical protein AGR1B_Cc90181 [Agrobacterium fabacearum S56]CVI16225.1 hypothetical protein AGR1A_Cc20840 [Agrobacterium fabacearum CFBP 5771]
MHRVLNVNGDIYIRDYSKVYRI